MTNSLRVAAWADESTQSTDGTFFVAVCEAGRPGYWTLNTGWRTLDSAREEADRVNELRNLSKKDVLDIRSSSMAEHNVGWRASDDALLHGDDPDITQS